jgi:hypothetical protein
MHASNVFLDLALQLGGVGAHHLAHLVAALVDLEGGHGCGGACVCMCMCVCVCGVGYGCDGWG